MVANQVARKTLFQTWFAMEVRFLSPYVIIGSALGGATWYLHRLSTRPDVVWSRKNPEPWQTVKQHENVKLMEGTHKFDQKY
ncbi:hypothetical protein CPB86DRAFT_682792, partial [Serendipita vermifera]